VKNGGLNAFGLMSIQLRRERGMMSYGSSGGQNKCGIKRRLTLMIKERGSL
jgi:hypothetical protein